MGSLGLPVLPSITGSWAASIGLVALEDIGNQLVIAPLS